MGVITIASLGFAFYVWVESKATRQLKYYINPARATVVQQGQTSGLSVAFNGQKIEGNITAAQIEIWNDGKLPIKPADILKPFSVNMADGSTILEATIRNPGREVSRLSLDTSKISGGRLFVNWTILEQGDGGIIQIIYSGDPTAEITVDAVIEGQKNIINPQIRTSTSMANKVLPGPWALLFSIVLAVMSIFPVRFIWTNGHFKIVPRIVSVVCYVVLCAGLAYGTYLSFTIETTVPFDFG